MELTSPEAALDLPIVPIRATLVVVPQSLVCQWAAQIAQHAPCMKALIVGVEAVTVEQLVEVDIVVTTYDRCRLELQQHGSMNGQVGL